MVQARHSDVVTPSFQDDDDAGLMTSLPVYFEPVYIEQPEPEANHEYFYNKLSHFVRPKTTVEKSKYQRLTYKPNFSSQLQILHPEPPQPILGRVQQQTFLNKLKKQHSMSSRHISGMHSLVG